jgi:hypothetical protein
LRVVGGWNGEGFVGGRGVFGCFLFCHCLRDQKDKTRLLCEWISVWRVQRRSQAQVLCTGTRNQKPGIAEDGVCISVRYRLEAVAEKVAVGKFLEGFRPDTIESFCTG